MANKVTHWKQCLLERFNVRHTAWIPTTFAKKDKIIKLISEDGYKVVEVYNPPLDHVFDRSHYEVFPSLVGQ